MDYFQVEGQCKQPDKSRSLQRRAIDAMQRMPHSYAHFQVVSRTADISRKYAFEADEMVHDFARSRASCENIQQNYRGEASLQPLHWPQQKPMNIAFNRRDSRAIQYAQLAPVGCGWNASRTW